MSTANHFKPVPFALLASLLLLVTLSSSAADTAATFDTANKLYEQGKFAEAAAAYEKLLAGEGASAELHFNLGNALFKAGQLGRAILHYRSAERLAPRDPDIQANLRFARDSVGGGAMTQRWWSAWLSRLSLNEWAWLVTLSLWLWLALLIAGQMRPSKKAALRGAVKAAGVVFAALAICSAAIFKERFGEKAAVVVVSEAVARFGPLEESESHFTLRNGAEVVIRDSKDGWWQVTDGQGHTGWVREKQAALLK